MANYQISADQISAGKTILVRGTLRYSRLTKLIDGEELAQKNARRTYPINQPHTSVTLDNPQVLPFDQTNGQLTLEERFVQERFRVSTYTETKGITQYWLDSKSRNLPIIGIPNEDGQLVPDTSGQELAPGLDVTLVLQTYKPQNYAQHGLRIEQVIVNEPVRYYGQNVSTEDLAARGIVWAETPKAAPATPEHGGDEDQQGVQNLSQQAPEGSQLDENGFIMPAPGTPQPVQQNTSAPQAPLQQPQQVQQAQPTPTQEDLTAELARLQAELERLRTQGPASQAQNQQIQQQGQSPWDPAPAQPGSAYPN